MLLKTFFFLERISNSDLILRVSGVFPDVKYMIKYRYVQLTPGNT